MPFCAQILDAVLFLPGVASPVTADFSWDPRSNAVPGARDVPAGLRRRLSPLGKAAAEALFSLEAFRNDAQDRSDDDAWVFSTRWGDLDASITQLRSLANGADLSPTAFATSVHNGIAGQLSIAAQHTGFVTAVAGGDAPFARGFETAASLLEDHPCVHFVLYDQGVVPGDPLRYAAAFTLVKLDPSPDEKGYADYLRGPLLTLERKTGLKGLPAPVETAAKDDSGASEVLAVIRWLLDPDAAALATPCGDAFRVFAKNAPLTIRALL